MKVLIINIDSKRMPNLALKKIEKYHLNCGDEVIWDMPIYTGYVDKIYVSCIFEKNKNRCGEWEDIAFIGGSGYNLKKTLPDEIEAIKPRINLGFTTRGCIRKCSFCIVPEKEGKIRIAGDLLDLWDGKSKDVILLDNNILAFPEHFKLICRQARENKIRLDFNQGLDHRLLNQEIIDELNSIRHQELHFAWDNMSDYHSVENTIDLLEENRIYRCNWLVLVGFNTTFEEDLLRINYLRNRNQVCYVMRFNGKTTKELTRLSRWVNNRSWFRSITWEEFLKRNYNLYMR